MPHAAARLPDTSPRLSHRVACAVCPKFNSWFSSPTRPTASLLLSQHLSELELPLVFPLLPPPFHPPRGPTLLFLRLSQMQQPLFSLLRPPLHTPHFSPGHPSLDLPGPVLSPLVLPRPIHPDFSHLLLRSHLSPLSTHQWRPTAVRTKRNPLVGPPRPSLLWMLCTQTFWFLAAVCAHPSSWNTSPALPDSRCHCAWESVSDRPCMGHAGHTWKSHEARAWGLPLASPSPARRHGTRRRPRMHT